MVKDSASVELLFGRMSHDMGVMSEWADDEDALFEEIKNADDEIFSAYWNVFCGE